MEVEKIAANRYRIRAHDHIFTVDAQDLLELDGLWVALGEDVGGGSKTRTDGKAGLRPGHPGRAQSIYAAAVNFRVHCGICLYP